MEHTSVGAMTSCEHNPDQMYSVEETMIAPAPAQLRKYWIHFILLHLL